MNIGAQWPTRKEAEATVLRTQTKLHRWAGERSPVDRLRSWRAGCSGTGTSGSEGGLRKRAGSSPGTAPQFDPTHPHTERGQMRCTLLRDSPTSLAIPRVDQWVASLGFSSKVLISARSTISPVIVGGTPERYSSANPGRRSRWKRPRHLHTVCGDVPTSRATAWLVLPSAQASTIRVRMARDCVVQGRRAHRSNVCLSSPLSSTAAVGLPRLAAMTTIIIGYHRLLNRSLGQETRTLLIKAAFAAAWAARSGK